jgi:hypothetical protein
MRNKGRFLRNNYERYESEVDVICEELKHIVARAKTAGIPALDVWALSRCKVLRMTMTSLLLAEVKLFYSSSTGGRTTISSPRTVSIYLRPAGHVDITRAWGEKTEAEFD